MICAETPLFLHISDRWPNKPNPVTSVAACTSNLSINFEANALSVAIQFTAVLIMSFVAKSRLIAVEIMPVPSGLFNTRASPTWAPEFLINLFSATSPVTTNPYFGSLSSMEWPPKIGMPASFALSVPPRRISVKISFGKSLMGNPTIFRANRGVAPMA